MALAACGDEPGANSPTSSAPAATASRQPSAASSAEPKTLDWYLGQLPQFGAPIQAAQLDLPPTKPVPLWYKVPTTDRVAFLTMDDGAFAHPDAPALLKASKIRITLFLSYDLVKDKADYFRDLVNAGAVIENHGVTHRSLRGLPYDVQRSEICGGADKLGELFGRRPTLYRPPHGEYDDNTLEAARDCGQIMVVLWRQTIDKGIVSYLPSSKTVLPGDIMLMHFRPAYPDDFLAGLKAMKKAGVQPALLEDYIVGSMS
ncbi:MAG: polysaccharide deacetylase family protein [Hamadaea sp.]|nr:polysaccharide deacetylase family protein [Hamadaea sp.]NUR50231.1 polysaccharide deacetylase family protein [Hamadaea sp.]